MRTIKNKFLKQSETSNRFSITPTFGPIVLIAITVAVYYYLASHSLFPFWISKIYLGLKIFIALEIVIGSAKTMMMPILTLIVGLLLLFVSQVYDINLIAATECWQLIFAAVFGFLVTLFLKF